MFRAPAATSTRVYADCSGLQDQPDGTVTQTCSLMVEVIGEDMAVPYLPPVFNI